MVNFHEINKKLNSNNMESKASINLDINTSIDDIEVLDEYKQILDILKQENQFIFVSGKAGTGKSTLIKWSGNLN